MTIQEEIKIKATAATIFKQYMDVAHWSAWDKDVVESSLDGDFKQGVQGSLKPSSGPKAKFTLTEVSTNKSFTDETKLPLCRMIFSHTLEESVEETLVTHRVSFKGLSSFFFSYLIGTSIKKGLPTALIGLKQVCEQKEVS